MRRSIHPMKQLIDTLRTGWRARRFERRLALARREPSVALVTRLAIRLIAADRLDEAEALVRLALARAPESPDLLEQFAFCAHNAGDYDEALERWRRVCALRPDLPMAWCGISANARELQRLDEATAAADEALRRFPDDVIVLTEMARVREYSGAHEEAVALWRRALPHPSADENWHLALARNLMKLARYDEVAAILAKFVPGDAGSAEGRRWSARRWCELAEEGAELDRASLTLHASEAVRRFGDQAFAMRVVAETTTELDAACEALRQLAERTPPDEEAHDGYVRVLLRAERLDDADRQVKIGLRHWPDDAAFQTLQGLIAIRRHDWEAACAFATAAAEKDPDDVAASQLAERMRRTKQAEEATTTGQPVRATPMIPEFCDEPETRALLLRFESFGQDCEFGLVQRCYGAEPLGLLRWTETTVASLVTALASRFEGVGDPQNTELFVDNLGEILVRDRRLNFAMHTFLYEHELSVPVLHPKMCRRNAFLRDKLLDDLRTGEKTIVLKSDHASIADLVALHDALLAFGPNRLLNARLASGSRDVPPGPPRSVTEIRPGLYVGHLSRMSDITDLAYDEWAEVCRGVERLRSTSAAADPSPSLASAA